MVILVTVGCIEDAVDVDVDANADADVVRRDSSGGWL